MPIAELYISSFTMSLESRSFIRDFSAFLRRRVSPDFLPPFLPFSLASLSLRFENGTKFLSFNITTCLHRKSARAIASGAFQYFMILLYHVF